MAAVEAAAIVAFNVLKVFNVLKAKGSRLNHFGYLAVYSVIKRSMSFLSSGICRITRLHRNSGFTESFRE